MFLKRSFKLSFMCYLKKLIRWSYVHIKTKLCEMHFTCHFTYFHFEKLAGMKYNYIHYLATLPFSCFGNKNPIFYHISLWANTATWILFLFLQDLTTNISKLYNVYLFFRSSIHQKYNSDWEINNLVILSLCSKM